MNKRENDEIKEKLPLFQTFFYGIAKFGWLLPVGFMGYLVYFYQIKIGLSWQYISIAYGIYAVWNAINDPLLGIMSDRSRHKLGRRIPYIRYGAAPFAISYIMLFLPSFFLTGHNQIGLFFYLLGTLFAYDTMFTLVVIVIVSLLGEMALTATIRTKIAFISGIIGGIGTVISTLLAPVLLINEQPLLRPIDPFQVTVIIFGAIMFSSLFISSYFLKEKKEFSNIQNEPLGFIDSIKYCIKNKPFMIIEGAIFGSVFLGTFIATAISYYIDYVLDVTGWLTTLPLILFFLANLVGSFFFSYTVGKIGLKKSLLYFSIPILCIGLFLILFPNNIYQAIPPIILAGFGEAGVALALDPLIMDTADFDELKTGKRREAAYFGINALITKPAESVATISLTGLLAAFSFVQPIIDDWGIAYPQPQPAIAIFGIRFLMSIFPMIIVGISAIFVYFYPLSGKKYEEMKLEVKKLHLEKEKNFLAKIIDEKPDI
jgi:GPH family glycoside/pentoside/hexuronide:cation symporter